MGFFGGLSSGRDGGRLLGRDLALPQRQRQFLHCRQAWTAIGTVQLPWIRHKITND